MKVFRSVFREQKTRLQIDWLTYTDELILEEVAGANDGLEPGAIAAETERSEEYVADRCRQLALRGLLDEDEQREAKSRQYRITRHGEQYLADELDADDLEEIGGLPATNNRIVTD